MDRMAAEDGVTTPAWNKWLFRILFWGIVAVPVIIWPRQVAVVVAGLAVFGLLVYWWIRRKIRKLFAPLEGMELFPTEIELQRQRRVDWHHGEEVAGCAQALAESGFDEIGAFTVRQMPGINMRAFIKPEESVFAVVYDDQFMGVWMDYVTPFTDGTYVTYTSSKQPGFADRPPGKAMERFPGHDARTLYARFLAGLPPKPRRRISADDFVPACETYFAEEKAWQAEAARRQDALEHELREAFLEKIQWSAVEWDRKQDRVVLIHDERRTWEVVDLYTNGLYLADAKAYEREEERARSLARDMPATAAFAAMVEQMPAEHGRFVKLCELTEPIRADAYLAPEAPDDWGGDD